MHEVAEPRVRRLVAEQLGVGLDALANDLSLRDDLAVDSLDLAVLSTALEAEFAISVPLPVFERIRTYRDLVETIGLLVRTRCGDEAHAASGRSFASRVAGAEQ
jgi:acyl carrier protein